MQGEDKQLKIFQNAIYMDKVERARSMSPEERACEVFEQSNLQMHMMHAGAMSRLKTDDEEAGWREVERWLDRLDYLRDSDFYTENPMQN
ncbi:MAG: hypothetical protein AAF226_15690 [Verrucomicrobiota bacterium]